jgi:hypothetical protein
VNDDELERIWKEVVVTYIIELLSQHLPGRLRKIMKNLMMSSVPPWIRTEHLSNTNLERYL